MYWLRDSFEREKSDWKERIYDETEAELTIKHYKRVFSPRKLKG
jgi:hypothetical protein